MSVRVEVPGKLVLLGEYAVLDGAPALVAAVDRGVRCEAWTAPDLILDTPGSNDHFVRPALSEVSARGRFRFTPFNPPARADDKVGLGSSAAATVAAIEAAALLRGETWTRARTFEVARRVHRRVQGSGSGIDVAASCFGGVLSYTPDTPVPLPDLRPDLVVIWSGQSARTGPRVERYQSWSGRHDFVRESASCVAGFASDPVSALRRARHNLEAMARAAGVAYRTPALDRIAELAEDHGGAAKPSGAGGGDIAVALLPDPVARAAFVQACAREGLHEVPVRVAATRP